MQAGSARGGIVVVVVVFVIVVAVDVPVTVAGVVAVIVTAPEMVAELPALDDIMIVGGMLTRVKMILNLLVIELWIWIS